MRDSLQKNPNFQNFWEFDACSDSRYQVLLSSYERERFSAVHKFETPPPPVSLSLSLSVMLQKFFFI